MGHTLFLSWVFCNWVEYISIVLAVLASCHLVSRIHRAGYWRYSSKATVQKYTRLWNINGWIATE